MYTEQERRIFGPYFNGAENVYADPIRAHRRLFAALDGDLNKYLREARPDLRDLPADESPEQMTLRLRAEERLLGATVAAFDLVPFDARTGVGALESDAWAVLNSYLEWLEKNGSRGPSCATCSLPSDPQSLPAQCPLPTTSASGSTATEPPGEWPGLASGLSIWHSPPGPFQSKSSTP